MIVSKFSAFHEAPEDDVPVALRPAFAVMLTRHQGGVLMVLSRLRKVWELPGGLIDPGETARQAAERELFEEAGCKARNTRWLGVMEVNDGQPRFGAVFDCETSHVPADFENMETVATGCWRRGDSLEMLSSQRIGHSDAALLARFG